MQSFKPTFSQQLIWLDQLSDKDSAKYNIGGYSILKGTLSYGHFQQTILEVLKSQEIYSTVFLDRTEGLTCCCRDAADGYTITCIDFSKELDSEASAVAWMEADFAQAFAVENEYLFQFKLLKLKNDVHFWYAKVHHLISDGWSFKLLLNQAAEIYSALLNETPLTNHRYAFSDYALEDEAYWDSSRAEKDRDFWLTQYQNIPEALFQKIRSVQPTSNQVGQSRTLSISSEEKTQLQEIANTHKVSLFQLIMTYVVLYFSMSRGQQTISLGIPVLNRSKKVYKSTAGVFMNLLPLRFTIDAEQNLADLLGQVKMNMRSFLRHQSYQYGRLLRDLNLGYQEKSLYQIRISYEDFRFSSVFGDLEAEAIALSNLAETDPLAIYMRDYHENGFDIRFVYNVQYFSEEHMDVIIRGLRQLLVTPPNKTTQALGEIQLLAPSEFKRIRQLASGTQVEVPTAHFLHSWKQIVTEQPDKIAVSTDNESFSYQYLDAKAQQLAHFLQTRNQVAINQRLALLLPRSEKMIIGMLGSLMAGWTYIPLEVDDPINRIQYILQDVNCDLVLTTSTFESISELKQGRATVLLLDQMNDADLELMSFGFHPEPKVKPCYIIYTSGSSGQPKGVVISNEAFDDYVLTASQYFSIDQNDVVLQQASFSFDTSVEEIFPVLSVGGRLHIIENRKDLLALKQTLEKQQITILSTSPLVLKFLNDYPLAKQLRILISGGDVLRPEYISNLGQKEVAIYNTYGPTESTVCATYYRVDPQRKTLPIGQPISNREVFIMNEQLQLQDFYTPGEIVIAGKGLAMEYLNRTELTKEKFIAHPFDPQRRAYRTGDMGYLLPNGDIMFKGRNDDQISFRGYRIELLEIELAIEQLEEVDQCIVLVKKRNEIPVLLAYVQLRQGASGRINNWKRRLNTTLPSFMIPEFFKIVETFPLMASGKIDKQRLPDIDFQETVNRHRTAPESDLEKEIQTIWQNILRVEDIALEDSFFQLGGNSINIANLVIAIRQTLAKSISIKDVFQCETFADLVHFVDQAPVLVLANPMTSSKQKRYPLSHAQERLWLLSQIEETSVAYHITGAMRLAHPLDEAVLQKAIHQLSQRHQALRTIFEEDEATQIYQEVLETIELNEVLQFHQTLLDDTTLDTHLEQWASQPFDLSKGPLFRIAVFNNDKGQQLLGYTMHHLISDGWSMEILAKELMLIYNALIQECKPQLPILSYQFHDFIGSIREKGEDQNSEQYWVKQFQEKIEPLQLPTKQSRGAYQTFTGAERRRTIDPVVFRSFTDFCQAESATTFMGLFAVLNLLLYKYTNQNSTVIGMPIANRNSWDEQNQIGLFLNILPIKTTFEAQSRFLDLLRIQTQQLEKAYEHAHYPIDKLIQQLPYALDRSRSPLFDILIVLHNQINDDIQQIIPENNTGRTMELLEAYPIPKRSAQFDLTFAFYFTKDSIELRLEYNTDLFAEWFVDQLAIHFENLLYQVVQHAEQPLLAIPYLGSAEHAHYLKGDYQAATVSITSIVETFLTNAQEAPHQVAIATRSSTITYQALEQKVRQTAAYFAKEKGIERGDSVAVILETSEWIPISMLAIWMIGGIYVPINVANPDERRKQIIQHANCKAIIDTENLKHVKKYPDSWIDLPITEEKNAYILFTSGTTGLPKGVIVSQQALMDKMQVENDLLTDISAEINTCLLTNYSFDVSFLELIPPLLTKGKIVIPAVQFFDDLEALYTLMADQEVNVLHGTPTFIDSLLKYMPDAMQQVMNQQLTYICMGGESLNKKLVEALRESLPSVQLHNLYGPTEAVIHATGKTNIQQFERNIIGKPIKGVRAYILDVNLQPVAKGIIGELFVGGRYCLAEGYINFAEETERRFVSNPYFPEEKIYRTGDVVRWTKEGEIEFLGRSDDQIKIRGFRVELGEIRQVMEDLKGIQQAVVTNYGEGSNMMLVAFVITESSLDKKSIQAHLSSLLPAYMVPAQIIPVERIPVNKNGKIDLPKLLEKVSTFNAISSQNHPPRNELDEQLLNLWKDILQLPNIGINDHFFDLGGNSILLVKMRTEIYQQLYFPIKIKDLLQLLTIRQLSDAITTIRWARQGANNHVENQEFTEFVI